MRTNGLVLIAVASAAGIAAWLLMHTALKFAGWISIFVAVGAFVFAPRALLRRQQRRTEQQFMVLFPDAIDMAIRMLRAGLPITAATRAIGNEAPVPVNLVFRSIADQVDIGVPFESALAAAGESIGCRIFDSSRSRFPCSAKLEETSPRRSRYWPTSFASAAPYACGSSRDGRGPDVRLHIGRTAVSGHGHFSGHQPRLPNATRDGSARPCDRRHGAARSDARLLDHAPYVAQRHDGLMAPPQMP